MDMFFSYFQNLSVELAETCITNQSSNFPYVDRVAWLYQEHTHPVCCSCVCRCLRISLNPCRIHICSRCMLCEAAQGNFYERSHYQRDVGYIAAFWRPTFINVLFCLVLKLGTGVLIPNLSSTRFAWEVVVRCTHALVHFLSSYPSYHVIEMVKRIRLV